MKVTCIFLLISLSLAYIELPITRVPHNTKPTEVSTKSSCPKEQLSAQFSEICYLKDISHAIQLYFNEQLYLIAMDLTIPISWIKSPHCKITNHTQSCSRLDRTIKQQITNKLRAVERKVKEKFTSDSEDEEDDDAREHPVTFGSIDKITGELNKAQNLVFWTKDSSKLTSLYKIFLIGLFLTDQKDQINLVSTNIVNATQVSPHANILSDGAISLRFDEDSENSFLNEIFTYVGSADKILTFYLGGNSTVTIGDLSVKNSEQGYAGIEWITLDQQRYPMMNQISIETIDSEDVESLAVSAEVIFTLSASYIALPEKHIQGLIKQLSSVAQCHVGKGQFLECIATSWKKWNKRRIIFQINDSKVVFETQQLHNHKKGNIVTLVIRQSESDYIIFGEPVFKKYFIALDYHLNRIGIANRRVTFEDFVFQTLTLVRVIVLVFVAACMFLICYKPVENLVDVFKLYYKLQDYAKGSDATGLKYSQFNDNTAYEDLSTKLRDSLYASGVEGI